MVRAAKSGVACLLPVLLVQGGCLAESGVDTAGLKCSPRESTVECCLKQNPGQWERCTGSPGPAGSGVSTALKAAAVGTAVAVALNPRIDSAERRGVELATDLRAKVEEAIWKCVREAERQANDHHFQGRSPSREQCGERKTNEHTWAAYLGVFKHDLARPCLRTALEKLVPGRYLLQPRFRLNARTGKWEYLDAEAVRQLVSRQGMKGLTGTIEPDLVLMDAAGVIIHVYDMKFPCPESNLARWERYTKGRWESYKQDDLYSEALKVGPRLVSPREGVQPR